MTKRVKMRKSIEKVVVIGFPYTMKIDTGRGIDRYLSTLYKSFIEHGESLRIIEEGLVKPHPVQLLRKFLKIFIALRRLDGELFHAVDPLGSVIAAMALKKNIVTTIHDTIPLDGKVKMFNSIVFLITKLSMKASLIISKEIIVPFDTTRDTLIKNFHVPGSKITIIHYALDLNLDPSASLDKSQNNSNKDVKILFMGGGSPSDRGLDIVLKAYTKFVENVPSATLTIVGRMAAISSENRKLLDAAKFSNIEILEFVPEFQLLQFMRKFSVFLYPSRLGFSYLVMQAMASGLPVITSNFRDMKDFLGQAGIMCCNEIVCCYVQALNKLSNMDLRTDIVKKQYERLQVFTLDNFYDGMNNFYKRALGLYPN